MLRQSWWRQKWLALRAKVPTHDDIFAKAWLKPLAPYFNKPYFWATTRRKVALAVAIGLFAGMMPGPTQMLTALILAYVLRANLPIALALTLYTNPLTYLPLYYAAYCLGFYILAGMDGQSMMAFADWKAVIGLGAQDLTATLAQQAKYLLLGVPLLSGTFAIIGYVLVQTTWRFRVLKRWRKRQHRRAD